MKDAPPVQLVQPSTIGLSESGGPLPIVVAGAVGSATTQPAGASAAQVPSPAIVQTTRQAPYVITSTNSGRDGVIVPEYRRVVAGQTTATSDCACRDGGAATSPRPFDPRTLGNPQPVPVPGRIPSGPIKPVGEFGGPAGSAFTAPGAPGSVARWGFPTLPLHVSTEEFPVHDEFPHSTLGYIIGLDPYFIKNFAWAIRPGTGSAGLTGGDLLTFIVHSDFGFRGWRFISQREVDDAGAPDGLIDSIRSACYFNESDTMIPRRQDVRRGFQYPTPVPTYARPYVRPVYHDLEPGLEWTDSPPVLPASVPPGGFPVYAPDQGVCNDSLEAARGVTGTGPLDPSTYVSVNTHPVLAWTVVAPNVRIWVDRDLERLGPPNYTAMDHLWNDPGYFPRGLGYFPPALYSQAVAFVTRAFIPSLLIRGALPTAVLSDGPPMFVSPMLAPATPVGLLPIPRYAPVRSPVSPWIP